MNSRYPPCTNARICDKLPQAGQSIAKCITFRCFHA